LDTNTNVSVYREEIVNIGGSSVLTIIRIFFPQNKCFCNTPQKIRERVHEYLHLHKKFRILVALKRHNIIGYVSRYVLSLLPNFTKYQ